MSPILDSEHTYVWPELGEKETEYLIGALWEYERGVVVTLPPFVEQIVTALWAYKRGTDMDAWDSLSLMLKVVKNKKAVEKTGVEWRVNIYDDDDTTIALAKPLKDPFGNEITDLAAGVLAQELKARDPSDDLEMLDDLVMTDDLEMLVGAESPAP